MARRATQCTAAITAMVARASTWPPIQPAATPASGIAPKLTAWLVVTTRPTSARGA